MCEGLAKTKNITVVTSCVIPVSKTWSSRVNLVHLLPTFGNRRTQTVKTHIPIVFGFCWLRACIKQGQCFLLYVYITRRRSDQTISSFFFVCFHCLSYCLLHHVLLWKIRGVWLFSYWRRFLFWEATCMPSTELTMCMTVQNWTFSLA